MIQQRQRVAVLGRQRGHDRRPRIRQPLPMFPGDWDAAARRRRDDRDPGQLRGRGEPALPARTTRSRASRSWCRRSRPPCCSAWRLDGDLRFAADGGVRRRDARRPAGRTRTRWSTPSSTTRWAFRPGSTRNRTCHRPTASTTTINTRAELIQYDPALADAGGRVDARRRLAPDVSLAARAMPRGSRIVLLFAVAAAGWPAAMPGRPS